MQLSDFHFDLPQELIAQRPATLRSGSRLLVLDGASGALRDEVFTNLPQFLRPGDLLVFNDTRVVPARLHGIKDSGGKVEILLERAEGSRVALVQARASKGLKPGAMIALPGNAAARMMGREGDLFRLEFSCDVLAHFEAHGEIPLPPYVARPADASDRDRYQTVYAREAGAVAAPTAGLHFDEAIFAALAARGVRRAFVTLHVGAGTFAPVRVAEPDKHVMHEELFCVPSPVCDAIDAARAAGGRVIAVGTTVVRSLETAAAVAIAGGAGGPDAPHAPDDLRAPGAKLPPYRGSTRLFIKPGDRFRVVDAMVTNFHLPGSTLLMLCAAFAGREALLAAYRHAVAERYRFFSYGDAMFITPMPAAVRA
jgi:S-adenosylmethionine:tRNA ribosyltransferase-isomerase